MDCVTQTSLHVVSCVSHACARMLFPSFGPLLGWLPFLLQAFADNSIYLSVSLCFSPPLLLLLSCSGVREKTASSKR